jgi:hypothetical protein
MKKLLFVAIAAAAAWWYFVGGRTLSEAQAADFYRGVERATLDRKPEDLCNMLADDFSATGSMALGGKQEISSRHCPLSTRMVTCLSAFTLARGTNLVTQDRITRLQSQIAHLRATEPNPANFHASASGFLAEVGRMQLEVREYLSMHPQELQTAAA